MDASSNSHGQYDNGGGARRPPHVESWSDNIKMPKSAASTIEEDTFAFGEHQRPSELEPARDSIIEERAKPQELLKTKEYYAPGDGEQITALEGFKQPKEPTVAPSWEYCALQPKPDWRPTVLNRPYILLGIIIASLLLYISLFIVSKKHNIVAERNDNINWIFLYGPAFLAIVAREYVSCMGEDEKSIFPYTAMALPKRVASSLSNHPLASIAQDTFPKSLRASFPSTYLLWLGFLYTIVIVPFQTTVFSTGIRATSPSSLPFMVATYGQINEALDSSLVPSIVVDALYHGANLTVPGSQPDPIFGVTSTIGTPVSFWVDSSGFDDDDSELYTYRSEYVAVIPFHPLQDTSQDAARWHSWSVRSPALFSGMSCFQLDNFSVSLTYSQNQAWDVEVNMTSSDDCVYQKTFPAVPLTGPGDYSTGAVGNQSFAIWRQRKDSNLGSPNSSSCSPFTHFILSGFIAAKDLTETPNKKTLNTENGSGWGALTCVSSYYIVDSTTFTATRPYTMTHDHLAYEEAREINQSNFDAGMSRNFIDNNLIYNLTDNLVDHTFWGVWDPDSFSPLGGVVDGAGTNISCTDISPVANEFTNLQTCQMLISVDILWTSLFLLTVVVAGLSLPFDSNWSVVEGQVTYSTNEGWYITDFSIGVTIALHLLAVFLLIGHIWKRKPTGLVQSPATLEAMLFLFRKDSTRAIFRGLASMEPENAVKETLRRLNQAKLRLRGFRLGEGSPVCPGIGVSHSRRDVVEDQALPTEDKRVGALPYGASVIWYLHFGALLVLLCALLSIITTVFVVILPKAHEGFILWNQGTSETATGTRNDVLRWIQKALFTIMPTLVTIILSTWWSKVDRFYRHSQPLADLSSPNGSNKALFLEYVNDPPLLITRKALKNHHWKLAYITSVTVVLKLAIVLAGGVFSAAELAAPTNQTFETTLQWRQGSFVANSNGLNDAKLFYNAMSEAVAGFPQPSGWIAGLHAFAPLNISKPDVEYSIQMNGIISNLSCEVASSSLQIMNSSGMWQAELSGGDRCQGAFWNDVCQSQSLSCVGWRYLNRADCPDISSGEGEWWLIYIQDEGEKANATSLLCTPGYYRDVFQTTLITSYFGAGSVSVTPQKMLTSQQLSTSEWIMQNGSDTVGFQSYFSDLLNSSSLVSDPKVVIPSLSMNSLSIMTALNMSGTTSSFSNATEFGAAASNVFSMIFALYASQNVSADGSTFLLEKGPSNQSMIVEGLALEERYRPSKAPLLTATGILFLYLVSILVVYPSKRWRTAMDMSYPANVVSLFCESSLAKSAFEAQDEAAWKAKVRDAQLKFGVYTNISGQRVVGIDFAKKVMDPEEPPSSRLSMLPSKFKRKKPENHKRSPQEYAQMGTS